MCKLKTVTEKLSCIVLCWWQPIFFHTNVWFIFALIPQWLLFFLYANVSFFVRADFRAVWIMWQKICPTATATLIVNYVIKWTSPHPIWLSHTRMLTQFCVGCANWSFVVQWKQMDVCAELLLCVFVCVCTVGWQTCRVMSVLWWNVKFPKLKPYVALGAISPHNDALFSFTRRLTD